MCTLSPSPGCTSPCTHRCKRDATQDLRPGVSLARTPQERSDVFRLRYEVYVGEQQKKLLRANGTDQTLEDPLDDWGHVLYTRSEHGVVGTVRANFADDGPLESEVPDPMQVEAFREYPGANVSYCSRLVLKAEWRTPKTLLPLLRSVYELGCRRGTKFNIVYCAQHLVPFFERLGYLLYAPEFRDPEVGGRTPMALVMGFQDHLKRVQSPFLQCEHRVEGADQAASWFLDRFTVGAA